MLLAEMPNKQRQVFCIGILDVRYAYVICSVQMVSVSLFSSFYICTRMQLLDVASTIMLVIGKGITIVPVAWQMFVYPHCLWVRFYSKSSFCYCLYHE